MYFGFVATSCFGLLVCLHSFMHFVVDNHFIECWGLHLSVVLLGYSADRYLYKVVDQPSDLHVFSSNHALPTNPLFNCTPPFLEIFGNSHPI